MTVTELKPQYDPSSIESRIYRRWTDTGIFAARADSAREPYVIVIPPPNVTAVLHMGHGLNNTIQDLLIRFERMRGREALWLPGTDHAGIATQNVVEKLLADEGKTKEDLGRETFVAAVWEHVHETGGVILEQLKAIGASCDWSRTRFTFDEGLSNAVREVFVQLYEKGLIYRGEYIINWCPRCMTALSNEEAEKQDADGKLWHLRYPIAGASEHGTDSVIVATTRPETMLGDTAVAVHPDDERYRDVVGKEVDLPLTGRRIPIVADHGVDPAFGSGAVKVTPAHDSLDFEIASRQNLPAINVMTDDARMNENVPSQFQGLDRFDARSKVVQALEQEGLLVKIDSHTHAVARCYRCGTIIEPRLSDQWFVKMKPLAEPALKAYHDGKIRFVPRRQGDDYERWLTNIRDWCISRQLWWGHRIPAWYCDDCGEVIVAREDPSSCTTCGAALRQDPDVLDTWFSSCLWPFSTFGWPEKNADLARFYPGHTLVTSPDIIFFWVARMIMMGLEFMNDVPFRTVFFHGIVRDAQHRKMSKSLGNGIDPLDIVELYGADALRFTVLSGSAIGSDVTLDYRDLETTFSVGRNFTNKVWNVGRFILSNIGSETKPLAQIDSTQLELADRWIISRTHRAVESVTQALEKFRLNDASSEIYHFVWNELADWYLEQVKPRLQEGSVRGDVARSILRWSFEASLRLLHPFMPFITEELWTHLPGKEEPLLAGAKWPTPDEAQRDSAAEEGFHIVQSLIGAVRNARAEYNVSPSSRIPVTVQPATDKSREFIEMELGTIERLAKVSAVTMAAKPEGVGSHSVLADGTGVFVSLGDAVNVERECSRLKQEHDRLDRLLAAVSKKLTNEQFVTRAPPEVVDREHEKERSWRDQRDAVAEKLRALGC